MRSLVRLLLRWHGDRELSRCLWSQRSQFLAVPFIILLLAVVNGAVTGAEAGNAMANYTDQQEMADAIDGIPN